MAADSAAASSGNAAIISRDGDAWQKTLTKVHQQKGDWSVDAAYKKTGVEKLGSRRR